jgi:flagellar biosynthesis chaperone FliJ
VNVNSVDKSTNIIGNVDLTKFIQIETALDQIPDPDKRKECKNSLQDLKDSVGTESYVSNYERFISTASDHMTLILPFIQFLSGFLKS